MLGLGVRRRRAPARPSAAPTGRPARCIDALRPARVVSAEGTRALPGGGMPTEEGDALVVATSGTAGEPKGVVLTHDAVHASAVATSQRLAVDPDRDRWLACLPFAHIGGLSVVTRALETGTPYRIHERFDARAVEHEAQDGTTWSPWWRRPSAAPTPRATGSSCSAGRRPPPRSPATSSPPTA